MPTGRARDGDIGVADENVVDDDLDDAADERVDDGDDGVVVRLHDGVRHEHDAVEHHGDAKVAMSFVASVRFAPV